MLSPLELVSRKCWVLFLISMQKGQRSILWKFSTWYFFLKGCRYMTVLTVPIGPMTISWHDILLHEISHHYSLPQDSLPMSNIWIQDISHCHSLPHDSLPIGSISVTVTFLTVKICPMKIWIPRHFFVKWHAFCTVVFWLISWYFDRHCPHCPQKWIL